MFDELYQELILDHSRNAHNRGSLSEDSYDEFVSNPVCGDELHLWVDFKDGRVADVKFSGQGCMISQAAGSMMTDIVCGANLIELTELINDFQDLLSGQASDGVDERIGDLMALEGVKQYPVRMRCALLAFEALNRIVKRIESKTQQF